MSALLEQVERTIQTRQLLKAGQPILVAVSGGVDSMVLLNLLYELSKRHRWRLKVAHLNHQLRGRSSSADERLVRRSAQRLGLPMVLERADVRGYARKNKVSVEMAARRLRHEFLACAAMQFGGARVALAHHADDQVELFFLRLLRGSGPEGLAGMKYRSPSFANRSVELVRPLLDQPKSALLEFARQQKIAFREDASNTCLDIQRNRLRCELLPLLRRRYQPGLGKTILRSMDLLGGEAEAVTQSAREWLDKVRNVKPTGTRTERASGCDSGVQSDDRAVRPPARRRYEGLPLAVQRRCLQLQLLEQGIAPDYDLIERLRVTPGRPIPLAGAGESLDGATTQPARATFCSRDADGLLHLEAPAKFRRDRLVVDLSREAGDTQFAGIGFTWRIQQRTAKPPLRQPGQEWFDAERVGSRILLRHWQPGDRFQPIGMRASVKLQNLFTNRRIPRARRHQLVVAATSAGDIYWVEGLRISERFKLTNRSIRRLQWRWQRL